MLVRTPREADFDAVLALLQASDRDVYGDTDWTVTELREQWDELDLGSDAWVVELDDRIAGVMHLCELRCDTFIGDGYVHPGARGRGVGTTLVHLLLERVAERLHEVPDGRVAVHLVHLAGDATAPALLEQEGFGHVRSFFRMVIDLEGMLPEPVWPDGIRVRPLSVSDDAAAIHATDLLAFSEEWGYQEQPLDAWVERLFTKRRVDPALPVVAWGGAVVAGYALNYPKRAGDWGSISVLGVHPAWRRQGLGLALLHESFRRFAATGETRVALGVDTANPTGATRLYERAGMRPLWQADLWEKVVRT